MTRLSNSIRWDYLASREFLARNEYAIKLLGPRLPKERNLRVLEIGGNPAPFIDLVINLMNEPIPTLLDPFISPIAEVKYTEFAARGFRVVSDIKDIESEDFDLIIFLGVDLSLARDYQQLFRDASVIRRFFAEAKMVITETPNYLPSKWIESFLATGLTKIDSGNIQVDAGKKHSLSADILNRTITIYQNTETELSRANEANLDKMLIRYADWHGMTGTPKLHPNDFPAGISGYDVQRLLNTWQVEIMPSGESFTWLRKNQRIRFPKHANILKIRYIQGIPPISKRGFFLSVEAAKDEILIKRHFPLPSYRLRLASWVPSELLLGESNDHRELTVAATSYEFTTKSWEVANSLRKIAQLLRR